MPGRPYGTGDPELAAHRLAVWRDHALRGTPVDDIAARLGLKRATLDQFVYRHRKAGNPLAVHHAHARLRNPDPDHTQLVRRASAARVRARRRERVRAERARLAQSSPEQ